MIVKVKHKELNDVKNKMFNDAERLNVEIDNLLQYLTELQGVWQGTDAEVFRDEAYNYINKMRGISECFNVMGNFINNANGTYEQSDNNLKKDLEKEAQDSEQYNNYQF